MGFGRGSKGNGAEKAVAVPAASGSIHSSTKVHQASLDIRNAQFTTISKKCTRCQSRMVNRRVLLVAKRKGFLWWSKDKGSSGG